MRLKALIVVCLTMWMFTPVHSTTFLPERKDYEKYCGNPDFVLIASTGRSGSTMLTKHLEKYIPGKVLKTHLLPPNKKCFKGKIIFIFSDPDQAAESALYGTFHFLKPPFGERHFRHVETADRAWLARIGGPFKQNEKDNLLSYDALGIDEHLKVWLHTGTKPATLKNAQILAVKYENLWDESTVEAIRDFLGLPHFKLPEQLPRGHKNLYKNEKLFRKIYNLGTEDNPKYAAYDAARALFEQAPPFQYLKIK